MSDNYEPLHLGKKEMLKVVDNAYQDIKKSKVKGTKKLTLGVLAVKQLINFTDEETLNLIWNEIIKFTDDLRHTNALNDPDMPNLSTLEKLKKEKQEILDKMDRLP